MHKLTRPTPPACLSRYRHGRDAWKTLNSDSDAKDAIWLKLDEMQQQRCAYCEIGTKKGSRHIEHLRQRSRYPEGTFEWANMFGSCNRQDSCGRYKDNNHLAYNYEDIIKMDVDDPESYLRFLPDGRVAPRESLDSCQKKRAEETIRVFNLNGSLRRIRENHTQGYLQTAEELAGYAEDFDEEDWRLILDEELDKIRNLPFATAIKHVLSPD